MADIETETKPVTQDDDEDYDNNVKEEDDDDDDDDDEEEENGEAATCNVLCSLGTSDLKITCSGMKNKDNAQWDEFTNSNSCCPKQLQLPMFLSSTFYCLLQRKCCYKGVRSFFYLLCNV
jgi:hypothetical protein